MILVEARLLFLLHHFSVGHLFALFCLWVPAFVVQKLAKHVENTQVVVT